MFKFSKKKPETKLKKMRLPNFKVIYFFLNKKEKQMYPC